MSPTKAKRPKLVLIVCTNCGNEVTASPGIAKRSVGNADIGCGACDHFGIFKYKSVEGRP